MTSQMTREQNSSLETWDSRQKKRDDQLLKGKEATAEKEKTVDATLKAQKRRKANLKSLQCKDFAFKEVKKV